jgi:hypothetical protein
VTHVGQEAALGLARRLGNRARLLQLRGAFADQFLQMVLIRVILFMSLISVS